MRAGKPDIRTGLQVRTDAAPDGRYKAARGRQPGGQPEGKASTQLIMFIVCIVALVIFEPPTFIVVAVGMAPTFVRVITHRDMDTHRLWAMALLNLAGMAFFLTDLWTSGNKLNDALRIVADVNALVVMYGAAGISLLLFWVAPTIAAGVLNVIAANRLGKLGRAQEALIREWGMDIGQGVAGRTKVGTDSGRQA